MVVNSRFVPAAASPRALKASGRRSAVGIHRRSDKALDESGEMFNPYISGGQLLRPFYNRYCSKPCGG